MELREGRYGDRDNDHRVRKDEPELRGAGRAEAECGMASLGGNEVRRYVQDHGSEDAGPPIALWKAGTAHGEPEEAQHGRPEVGGDPAFAIARGRDCRSYLA